MMHLVRFRRSLTLAAALLCLSCLVQGAQAAPVVTVFTLPFSTAGQAASPMYAANGSDGNIWFTEEGGSPGERIDRVTTAGVISRFWLGLNAKCDGITSGPDNNLWFCISNAASPTPFGTHQIGKMDPNNPGTAQSSAALPPKATYTTFDIPTASAGPWGICTGPDNNLWFTEVTGNKIGRITTTGTITEFSSGLSAGAQPREIVAGPDGNLWFTETGTDKIGRITTAGAITEFSTGITSGAAPYGICVGPDNNLWFTESGTDKIGRITTAGVVTEFTIPTATAIPVDITAGPDGALWFTEFFACKVGQITTAGVITETNVPTRTDVPGQSVGPHGIITGPDNALWFAEQQVSAVGRVDIGAPVPAGPVTNTNDSGAGSLRQAIIDANANVNLSTIAFNIPNADPGFNAGTGKWTISPTSALPAITSPVIIDATTQPGFSPGTPVPVIVVNGTGAGAGTNGFTVSGGGSTIRGLIIVNFTSNGIELQTQGGNTIAGCGIGTEGLNDLGNGAAGIFINASPNNLIGGPTLPADANLISGNNTLGIRTLGAGATNNVIQGNGIGTNLFGTAAIANGTGGISLNDGGSNRIGLDDIGNTISGNTAFGLYIAGGNGNVITSNKIGTNATGTAALANAGNGITIETNVNTVGGNTSGKRNVISGNTSDGVLIGSFSIGGGTDNVVQGNYIGTNAAGTAALGNGINGVHVVDSSNTIVGGSNAGEGNVISAHKGSGVLLEASGGTVSGNIEGNFIGTNAAGTAGIGNGEGVGLTLVDPGTTVKNNVIAASTNVATFRNGDGINLLGPNFGLGGCTITGNKIGTASDGTTDLGNTGHGILITDSSFNTIGDTTGGANVVAFNDGDGVAVVEDFDVAVGNNVRGNSIHSNSGLGIDLGNDGVTANDDNVMDADTGANNLQNFPVLEFANAGSTNATVTGSLDSLASTPFDVDLYINDSGSQGKTLLGSTTVTTDAGGKKSFTATFATVISTGKFITATATDPNGNTSEFSAAVTTEGTYNISGLVRTSALNGIAGVSVALTNFPGGTNPAGVTTPVTTDAGGFYQFTNVPSGLFTITPTKAGYTFSPTSQGLKVSHASRAANFVGTASAAFSISGRASTGTGAAIPNVSVQLNVFGGGAVSGITNPVLTNSAGFYTFNGVFNGNYTIVPTKAGTTFTPVTRDVTVAGANLTNENFTGATGHKISGRVATSGGVGINGVLISIDSGQTATSNSAGYYTVFDVPDGSRTITPTKAGTTFAPVNKVVSMAGVDITNQNFTGS